MKYLIMFLLILIFILFLPIPIKIKIYYCNESYFIKFYNITLFSDKGGIINKLLIKDKKTLLNLIILILREIRIKKKEDILILIYHLYERYITTYNVTDSNLV